MAQSCVRERAVIENPRHGCDFFDQNLVRYRFACQFVSGRRVLDVACGTGYGSSMLGNEGGAEHVLGLDSEGEALGAARSFAVSGKVDFAKGRAEHLPVNKCEYDVVVSLETIEHLEDPSLFIKEVRRVLKPGGMAIISTPLNNSEGRFRPDNPFHIREYSSGEFVDLLRVAFDHVELWSQLIAFQDDIQILERSRIGSRIRRGLSSVTPPSLRRTFRRAIGSKGRHAVHSQIVRGFSEQAAVQVAICY